MRTSNKADDMDPNATLAAIREIRADIFANADFGDGWGEEARALAEHIDNLDVWLSKGGFPPEDWAHRWIGVARPRPLNG